MIHQYKFGDYNIVLDVCSGALHIVDDTAYDAIAMLADGKADKAVYLLTEKYADLSENEARECIRQIEELKEAGKLFSEDSFGPLAGTVPQRTGGVIKALCLHVAHTCNLNCAYCFAAQGKYHGESAIMSFETGKRALDFLVENSGTRRNLEVDFFGGEPLMNFAVVKKLVKYARSIEKEKNKNFRFTLTTNGMLLDDEVTQFCNREMHNVVLSLDGRREIHDKYRVDCSGNGSWDKIVPKFQKFVKERGDKEYYIRGTFTHSNPDFLEDIKAMLALGFKKLSMEPVVAAPEAEVALTAEDMPVIKRQYEELARLMLEYDKKKDSFVFYHYMLDIKGGPCIYKRISGCGSGTEYMAVTPSGDLYPCHQFVGKDEFKIGSVFDGVQKQEVCASFAACNIYTREKCRTCWARLYCSGGCAANAYNATGSVNGVYEYGCELFKKRMECAIALAIIKETGGLI